jgi:hypothetical protein
MYRFGAFSVMYRFGMLYQEKYGNPGAMSSHKYTLKLRLLVHT